MKNLKKLRTARNITQIGLQMSTGIDQSLLSKYENGERTPTTQNLVALADFFDTSTDYLLERVDRKEPYPRKT